MGLPVTGQVTLVLKRPHHKLSLHCTSTTTLLPSHFTLVSECDQYEDLALSLSSGFLIWVFPTMYISQKLRLGKYLGANIVLWGIIMMLHAVPKSFGPFFVLRLLLGNVHVSSLRVRY